MVLGADTFSFVAGDNGLTSSTLDRIADYAKGALDIGDAINYSSALSVGGSSNAATGAKASINQTTGIATFAPGSGTTLADAINDIAARFTSVGDYYQYISDGVAGADANDVLIRLVGVSTIASIDFTYGELTLTA